MPLASYVEESIPFRERRRDAADARVDHIGRPRLKRAIKRRADLIRRAACTDKAEKDKVVKRDLASYVNNCMDAAEKAQQVDTEPKMKQ